MGGCMGEESSEWTAAAAAEGRADCWDGDGDWLCASIISNEESECALVCESLRCSWTGARSGAVARGTRAAAAEAESSADAEEEED